MLNEIQKNFVCKPAEKQAIHVTGNPIKNIE